MSTTTLEEDEKREKEEVSHLIRGTGTPAEEREEERENEG
jgi:hypothetical protein